VARNTDGEMPGQRPQADLRGAIENPSNAHLSSQLSVTPALQRGLPTAPELLI
jgi:hypothetical protein